jgi:hypothetical protein
LEREDAAGEGRDHVAGEREPGLESLDVEADEATRVAAARRHGVAPGHVLCGDFGGGRRWYVTAATATREYVRSYDPVHRGAMNRPPLTARNTR